MGFYHLQYRVFILHIYFYGIVINYFYIENFSSYLNAQNNKKTISISVASQLPNRMKETGPWPAPGFLCEEGDVLVSVSPGPLLYLVFLL